MKTKSFVLRRSSLVYLLFVKRRNYGHQFFNESELTMLALLIQKLPLTAINKCLILLPLTVIHKMLSEIDVNFVLCLTCIGN